MDKKSNQLLSLELANLERQVKTRALRSFRVIEEHAVPPDEFDPGQRSNLIRLLEGLRGDQAVLLAGAFEYLSREGVK